MEQGGHRLGEQGPVSVEEGGGCLVHSEGLGGLVLAVYWGHGDGCAVVHDPGGNCGICGDSWGPDLLPV